MKKTPFKLRSPFKDTSNKRQPDIQSGLQSFSNTVVDLGKTDFSSGTSAIPNQKIIPSVTPTHVQDADILAQSIKGLSDLNAVGGKSNASFKAQYNKLMEAGAVGDAAKLAKKHAKWNMRQERKEARQDPTKSKPTKTRKESWQDFRTRNILDYQLADNAEEVVRNNIGNNRLA